MKARYIFLAATAALIFSTAPAYSHDVPNMQHTHAFQQTAYGKYRQGHYVNGPQGSITSSGQQEPTRVTRLAQR